jgi:hypothetical protein
MLGQIDHCGCSRMSCGGLVAAGRPPVFAWPTLGALSFYCYGLRAGATNEGLHYATRLLRSMLSLVVPLCRIRPFWACCVSHVAFCGASLLYWLTSLIW